MWTDARSRWLFALLFLAYAYFHQGGGWNQNSRFNQVRAVAEEGSWSINRFLAYRVRGAAADRFERIGVPEDLPPDAPLPPTNGYDIAVHEGRIYPNKPPGVTLLALPVYAVAHFIEGLAGADPDAWRILTLNLYLVTVFSTGWLGAAVGVVLYRLSRRLHPGLEARWHAASALAFGLGTLFFPFATMLFDHVAVGATVLVGFGLALAAVEGGEVRRSRWRLAGAGFVLGFGVLVNYSVALVVALIGLYLLARLRRRFEVAFFVAGGALPALFHLGYHAAAFGSAWTIANVHQHWLFVASQEHLLGVFSLPDLALLAGLVLDPYRGLLASSPVLVLALYGWASSLLERRRRLEALFVLAVFGVFLVINASFNEARGGNGYGPRYLLPAVPLIGLYLAPALARWPKTGLGLAALSALLVLSATATDPQIPAAVERPLPEHVVPALLDADPVSRNATGVYEAFPYQVYGKGSFPARWNSFNLGELLVPHSLWSLLPLVAILVWGTRRVTRVDDMDDRDTKDGAS